ncbi:MAG: SAM-dependent chlorinase/fluorinase [Candidatus Eremiobacteraeota bacterium]|nr:SAM-dependent chlorinase/fluorinase [Candidatus Eremiobacteraeota bacterium]
MITLLTDFGLQDPYVGVMKGVMLSICPAARMVDLSHLIPAQDIDAAGLALARAYRWFAPGTVHLAVVDPGVGSQRRAIAVESAGHRFVAPDNGLLTRVLARTGAYRAHQLQAEQYRLPEPSQTFHGRDIFAPAAAWLAGGLELSALGPELDQLVLRPDPAPEPGPEGWTLTIIGRDHFGNLVTNLDRDLLGTNLEVRVGGRQIPLCTSYTQVEIGQPLAIWGSDQSLELSVNQGDAGAVLGLKVGDPIAVVPVAGSSA